MTLGRIPFRSRACRHWPLKTCICIETEIKNYNSVNNRSIPTRWPLIAHLSTIKVLKMLSIYIYTERKVGESYEL